MSILPKFSPLKIAKLRNGACFVGVGVLFCVACWVFFANDSSSDETAGLSEEQLESDISLGLGALGVNRSAAKTTARNDEPAELPFEISASEAADSGQQVFRDSAIRPISNEANNQGPLFNDPISDTEFVPSARRQAKETDAGQTTQTQKPAWLTGKIEFE